MKKSKIYFLAPIVALVLFAGYYWKFSAEYEAVQDAKAAVVKANREAKLREEAATREKAIKDAVAQQEERKKERAENDAKDRARRENREAALQARDKARIEADKVQRQSERLAKEVQVTKDEIAKLVVEGEHHASEEAFLRQYVAKTQENVKSVYAVLDKIAAADDANAKATAYSKDSAALEIELDTLHKQKEQSNREDFDLLKQVELARVGLRAAEMENQRMVGMIAGKADDSFLTRMPPPPPPEKP